MYEVISKFVDLKDGKHVYHVGDQFPREGIKVSQSRVNELLTDNNKQKKPLIVRKASPVHEEGTEEVKTNKTSPKTTKGKKSTRKAKEDI